MGIKTDPEKALVEDKAAIFTARVQHTITELKQQGVRRTGPEDLWGIVWRHAPGQGHWELAEIILFHTSQTAILEATFRRTLKRGWGWGGFTFLAGAAPLADQIATIPMISIETGKMLPHTIPVGDSPNHSGFLLVTG